MSGKRSRQANARKWISAVALVCAASMGCAVSIGCAANAPDPDAKPNSTGSAVGTSAQSWTPASAKAFTTTSATGLTATSASSPAVASAAAASSTTSATAGPTPQQTPAPPTWLGQAPFTNNEVMDVIVAGGRVVDGTGARATVADVVIHQGRILHVGKVAAEVTAKTRINAAGLTVSPGFIDVHSHAGVASANRNLLAMGVTTAVVGQDGRSPSKGKIAPWISKLSHTRLSVNIATLVGHGTLRGLAYVGGKSPNKKQIARMTRLLEKELDAGAFGLSSGLEYQPGAQASRDELVGIARAVAARDGVIMSHLRSEDDDLIDSSLDELLAQGVGGARVHAAHLKVVYGKGAGRAEALLNKLASARKRGIEVTADIYPYNASYTTISIVFPPFAKPPASFQRARSGRRNELAVFLRNKIKQRGGPDATLFGSSPFTGKTLAQLAKERGKPFEDVLIDDIGPGGASAAYFVMDDALQARLLTDPMVMVGTDGGSYSSHPRGHGTFARVIAEHVRKRKALSLTEAVRKMSGLAAHTMRFNNRGTLTAGSWADVLVFDPDAIQDHATYARPHQLSSGMRWVFVNGRAALANGKFTNRRAGRLLTPKRAKASNAQR